jgi:transposase-like protein
VAYQKIEVITGVERRRRWTAEDKGRILAEAAEPGAIYAHVARRHGICRSVLRRWRRAAERSAGDFIALGVIGCADDSQPMVAPTMAGRPKQPRLNVTDDIGGIEVALPNGARIRVDAFVNEQALSRVFRALKAAL